VKHLPGLHSATTLFGLGLPSEGIIRGLMIEIGLTYEEAALTTSVAEREHSRANDDQSVPALRARRREERSRPHDD